MLARCVKQGLPQDASPVAPVGREHDLVAVRDHWLNKKDLMVVPRANVQQNLISRAERSMTFRSFC
jgi:hypothetical protein